MFVLSCCASHTTAEYEQLLTQNFSETLTEHPGKKKLAHPCNAGSLMVGLERISSSSSFPGLI